MADSLPSAVLRLQRSDGSERKWRVPLTPQTPLDLDELRRALVDEFVGVGADADGFTLRLLGTAGSPIFELKEEARRFGQAEEII